MKAEAIGRVMSILGFSPKPSMSPTTSEWHRMYTVETDKSSRTASVVIIFDRTRMEEPVLAGFVVSETEYWSAERAHDESSALPEFCSRDLSAVMEALAEEASGSAGVIECESCGRAVSEYAQGVCFDCGGFGV